MGTLARLNGRFHSIKVSENNSEWSSLKFCVNEIYKGEMVTVRKPNISMNFRTQHRKTYEVLKMGEEYVLDVELSINQGNEKYPRASINYNLIKVTLPGRAANPQTGAPEQKPQVILDEKTVAATLEQVALV